MWKIYSADDLSKANRSLTNFKCWQKTPMTSLLDDDLGQLWLRRRCGVFFLAWLVLAPVCILSPQPGLACSPCVVLSGVFCSSIQGGASRE